MRFLEILKSVYFEAPVADETLWHKRLRAPWYARTNGHFLDLNGQIWRRKHNGKWEYQQDEETPEDFVARQW